MTALTAVVALLLVAVSGWGYLKFRAIEKVSVDNAALGVEPEVGMATVPYELLFPEAPALQAVPEESPVIGTNDSSPEATGETTAGIAPASQADAAAIDDGSELLPEDPSLNAPPTVDAVTAEALAAADAQDAAEVKGAEPAPATAAIEFPSVPPGPIVDVQLATQFGGSGTKNYLMIGVDDRADVPKGQDVAFGVGKVGGSRTDTIFVMRIDANAHKAWILSIPRDLWLPQATSGKPSRINSVFAKGANELVKTISQRLAIPIHHVVKINFGGFQRMVATIGGVEICFNRPTRDLLSGLNRPDPGCQVLNERAATAYVRSRHYQEFVNGKWVTDPRSDLGRIVRQQGFMRAVMSKALDRASNPLTVNAMLDDLKKAIAIDSTFTFPETTSLANDLRSFDPNSLEAYTLPTVGARVGGAAVLRLNTKKAAPLLAKFRG